MVKLFYGTDSFSLNKAALKHTEAGDAEVQIFEDGIFESFLSQLLSQSFFATKRVFVVKNLLKKLDSKSETKLLEILPDLPGDTLVIFVEEELPKSKIAELIKKSTERFLFFPLIESKRAKIFASKFALTKSSTSAV